MLLTLPGEFKVQLPDGRVQVTSYVADDYGYRPHITYLYPEQAAVIKHNNNKATKKVVHKGHEKKPKVRN